MHVTFSGICLSGASSNLAFGTAFDGSLLANSKLVGERLGCPVNNSAELVDCLKEADPFELNFWGLWSSATPECVNFFLTKYLAIPFHCIAYHPIHI